MFYENKQVWDAKTLTCYVLFATTQTNENNIMQGHFCDDSCLRSFYGTIPSKYEKPKTFWYRKNVFIATAII